MPAPGIDLDEIQLDARPGALDDIVDLPAPKRTLPRSIPDPSRGDTLDDLPEDVVDLLAPKPGAVIDLPAPKRAVKHAADVPKAPGPRPARPQDPDAITDLPAPKRSSNVPEVPIPRTLDALDASFGDVDLPAPKGFFDDLPQVESQPAEDIDLPAPKGFFDDIPGLPNPNRPELPAPKGFFDDLPRPALKQRPELPAPKGFFDDLPQVKSNPSTTPDLPAPKGFFDDIPGLPSKSKPELPAPQGFFDDIPGLPSKSKPELPVPQGHFENIPGRPIKKSEELAPKGFFDDLPQPGPAATGEPRKPAAPRAPAEQELEPGAGPELDLVSPASASAGSFDDLDLSKPSSPVRFESQPQPRAANLQVPAAAAPRFDAGPSLELEGAIPEAEAARAVLKRPHKPPAVVEGAAAPRAKPRRTKLVIGGLALVVALGGGGFVLYQRHVAAQERAAAIAEQLEISRKSYAASDPLHWQRAAAAAKRVLELDAAQPEAIGIGAESLLASAIGDGTAIAAKLGQARALLETASDAGIASPQIGRARALSQLATRQPDAAIAQLQPLAARAPKDGNLALYLGWALAARGDDAAAVKAFDTAMADAAAKLGALYGRGNARLELADLDGARTDFAAVLELAKDHIGAQVGLAAAQPSSAVQQQEADLLAILERKDITAADPRVVARAWTLAGRAAARAGRLSVARERFRKALAVIPQDLAATTGLAETELQDGKVTAAAELTAVALNLAKDNVPAQLVQSEIELKQGKLPLAAQRLAALANHATPLTPLEQARLHLITGRLLEAQGKNDDAVDAYTLGAKAAGDLDLAPLMAAVGKLAAMTAAATEAKDATRAGELRARSEQMLGELATAAEHDPRLAMTLGMAYLQQGDPAKAEPWLRRVIEARPNDAEARFQLGRALLKAGKNDAALEILKSALERDPARVDIGVDLARAYEALGRDPEAGALYAKLLAGKDPSLELRTRAGKYFVRTGAPEKAAAQGAKLVEADPHNAAGLYLKGEGLLASGKAQEAKQAFLRALEIERDPQYLDAVGRAAEALAQDNDRAAQDLALRSYHDAAEAVPPPLSSLTGQGRLFVARHEAAKALDPLLAASRIEPRNAEVMFLIGAAYQELQKSTTALQWLEASTRIGPRAEAFWRIGQIYRDANQGARAAVAVDNATRLAAEAEKRTGKQVPWLTDALYLQGRVNLDLHNEARAREAWITYVARNPPASARLTEVQQLLATTLR